MSHQAAVGGLVDVRLRSQLFARQLFQSLGERSAVVGVTTVAEPAECFLAEPLEGPAAGLQHNFLRLPAAFGALPLHLPLGGLAPLAACLVPLPLRLFARMSDPILSLTLGLVGDPFGVSPGVGQHGVAEGVQLHAGITVHSSRERCASRL